MSPKMPLAKSLVSLCLGAVHNQHLLWVSVCDSLPSILYPSKQSIESFTLLWKQRQRFSSPACVNILESIYSITLTKTICNFLIGLHGTRRTCKKGNLSTDTSCYASAFTGTRDNISARACSSACTWFIDIQPSSKPTNESLLWVDIECISLDPVS